MSYYQQKMKADKQYGSFKGRELNLRGNFTRTALNKNGEPVVKEMDKVNGTIITNVRLSYIHPEKRICNEDHVRAFQATFDEVLFDNATLHNESS